MYLLEAQALASDRPGFKTSFCRCLDGRLHVGGKPVTPVPCCTVHKRLARRRHSGKFFSSVSLTFPVLKMERLLSAGLMGLLGKFQGLAKQVPHRVSALNPVLPSPPTEAQVAKQRGCLLQKESGG